MQRHFYKEDHAIFPMAEKLFSDEEKRQLYAELTHEDVFGTNNSGAATP